MTAAPGTGALEEGGHLFSMDSKLSVLGTALAPNPSNPTQTAGAAADTIYNFGTGGNTSANHYRMQNNNTINALVAFDQSTTGAGNEVYVLAPGQWWADDRTFTNLHFSSASPIAFGGSTGLTVEAFA